jgi:high-affinity K+ transport system ATPase subunit B
MNKLSIVVILLFASCASKTKNMTESEIKAKADSLVGIRIEELNRQAIEDFDRRKSIEVKIKADSIVQASLQADNAQNQR